MCVCVWGGDSDAIRLIENSFETKKILYQERTNAEWFQLFERFRTSSSAKHNGCYEAKEKM